MTDDRSKMRDGDMPLLDRIESALRRVTSNQGQMRVPAEATDPDVVLFDCKREIERLRVATMTIASLDLDSFAALLDERDRLRKALEQARPALEHAATICDGVPTRDPGYLGQLVNVQPTGFHGYRLIHDALDALRAALGDSDAQ